MRRFALGRPASQISKGKRIPQSSRSARSDVQPQRLDCLLNAKAREGPLWKNHIRLFSLTSNPHFQGKKCTLRNAPIGNKTYDFLLALKIFLLFGGKTF